MTQMVQTGWKSETASDQHEPEPLSVQITLAFFRYILNFRECSYLDHCSSIVAQEMMNSPPPPSDIHANAMPSRMTPHRIRLITSGVVSTIGHRKSSNTDSWNAR